MLFEAKIHEEAGNYEKALQVLEDKKGLIVDRVNKLEALARNYSKVGNKEKAVESYEELLQLNSSNYAYYYRILEAQGVPIASKLSEEEQSKALEVLEGY